MPKVPMNLEFILSIPINYDLGRYNMAMLSMSKTSSVPFKNMMLQ